MRLVVFRNDVYNGSYTTSCVVDTIRGQHLSIPLIPLSCIIDFRWCSPKIWNGQIGKMAAPHCCNNLCRLCDSVVARCWSSMVVGTYLLCGIPGYWSTHKDTYKECRILVWDDCFCIYIYWIIHPLNTYIKWKRIFLTGQQ